MAPLRVAIIHYHLRTGGVTRVVQHALSSLADKDVECVVLTGEQPPDPQRWACVRVLPDLGYGAELGGRSPSSVVRSLIDAARDVLGGEPDIWHIHNHALGKNVVLPAITKELAASGSRLVLQIHDFAEDGRPQNYHYLAKSFGSDQADELGDSIYPQGTHIYYAPLNGRDAGYLKAAGVPPEQIHMLHNPAAIGNHEVAKQSSSDDSHRVFLYPTRAIRRKNIGEFILWSALADEGDRYGVTLAPENPVERRMYDTWVEFAVRKQLPVDFELGAAKGVSFEGLVAQAHAIVTTSVAEGFGLAFLEPWLMGKVLLGRNLPEITSEFSDVGINLDSLYDGLRVPLEWVDVEGLRKRLQIALDAYYAAYGWKQPSDALDRAWSAMVDGVTVEFSHLDEDEQRRVIGAAREDDTGRRAIRPQGIERGPVHEEMLQRNLQTVLNEFSLQKYGERLVRMYTSLMNAPIGSLGEFSASNLLAQFLAPERFRLLRT